MRVVYFQIDAYHEEALMSFSSSFNRSIRDDSVKRYIGESRNLQVIQEYKRSQLIHQKRVQIVGFLDKLPKTKHDITSFTLDVPFVNVNENGGILSFTVTGVFKWVFTFDGPVEKKNRLTSHLKSDNSNCLIYSGPQSIEGIRGNQNYFRGPCTVTLGAAIFLKRFFKKTC